MTTAMRAWLLPVIAASAVACGDNTFPDGAPLAPGTELTIVAAPGDDLAFLQPDLYDAVRRGTGATNVYVTTGDVKDLDAAEARRDGLLSAYSAITGAALAAWSCGWIELSGHAAEHCRLTAAKLSLVFLAYPDGGKDGAATDSLLHLWEAKVQTASTFARVPATYDQRGLIATLAGIVDATAPTTLRTGEVAATHGNDHSDHMLAGALAVLAAAASSLNPALISHRGDNIAAEPANISLELVARGAGVVAYYDACARGCAPCGRACTTDRLDPDDTRWLPYHYAIGIQRTATGKLALDGGCLTTTSAGANAAIGDCAAAPTWQLDDRGVLRASTGLCLKVIFTGEIIAGTCDPGDPGGRFFFDDEGHLWSGVVPAPADDMAFAHLSCVGSAGGRPRAGLCGANHAPTLSFVQTATAARH